MAHNDAGNQAPQGYPYYNNPNAAPVYSYDDTSAYMHPQAAEYVDPALLGNIYPQTPVVPSNHIEQFDYRQHSLTDAIDDRRIMIPSAPTDDLRSPARFRENTDGFSKDKKKMNPWVKAGIATAAVIATGIAAEVGYTVYSYKQLGDTWKNRSGEDKSVSAPAVPGQEGVSNDGTLDMFNRDITHEDYGRQLNVTLPYLQEHRAQSMQEASNELDLQNRVNPLKESELPADMTLREAQIDQNNITADLWTISKETNSTLAHNLLNAVFFNDLGNSNDGYDVSAKHIGSGKRILEPTTVMEVSPVFTSGKLGGIDITGQPSYIVQLASRTTGSDYPYDEVISRHTSQDGKLSNPVVVQTMQHDEPAYVESPAKVTPQK